MSIAINYQLSIFGKYSVSPTPEVITKLMTGINEASGEMFLPNIINSQQIELPSNRITAISNLGFVTQNQQYNIVLLNERIDVSYNKILDAEIDMDGYFLMAEKILSVIMGQLNLTSNRLAVNIQMLAEIDCLNKLNTLGKFLIKSIDYYNDKDYCEWSTRTNSNTNININGLDERINVITDISSAQSVKDQKPAILYHIDINTVQQNMSMRFNNSHIKAFVDKVLPISHAIITDVERVIVGD